MTSCAFDDLWGNTDGENIIAPIKIQNNYGAIQSLIFSAASCKVITLNPLCILFNISSLLLFLMTLSLKLSLYQLLLLQALAKSNSNLFSIAFKSVKERQLHEKHYRKEAMNQSTKEIKSGNFCYDIFTYLTINNYTYLSIFISIYIYISINLST